MIRSLGSYSNLNSYIRFLSGSYISSFDPENNQFKEDVIDRNILWLPKITKNQNCFFVFGCGHFLGKYGLKNLLEKDGYTFYHLENSKDS